jgi:DNA-binding response OmpR family regulator
MMECPCCKREGWKPAFDTVYGDTLFVGGDEIHLTKTELDIFAMLRANIGQVVPKDRLRVFWAVSRVSEEHIDRNIPVQISHLRKKIRGHFTITGLQGHGYRMDALK